METKNEKWKRLAKARANKVLNDFRLLTNLKGSGYEASMDEKREVLAAIRTGLDELEAVWSGAKVNKAVFKFRGED